MSMLETRIRQAREPAGHPAHDPHRDRLPQLRGVARDRRRDGGGRRGPDGAADPVLRAHGRRPDDPRAPTRRRSRAGATVERCFEFAATVTRKHPIPFLFMTYYNLLFRGGVGSFVERARKARASLGAIVPDLPPEEAGDYLPAMERAGLDPIFIFSPSSPPERMREIAKHARGFVYCVARKGVTGAHTDVLRRARRLPRPLPGRHQLAARPRLRRARRGRRRRSCAARWTSPSSARRPSS